MGEMTINDSRVYNLAEEKDEDDLFDLLDNIT